MQSEPNVHPSDQRSNGDALPDAPAQGRDSTSRGRPDHETRTEHHDDHDAIPTDLPRIGTGGVLLIAVVVLALFAALFVLGWKPHAAKLALARDEAADAADAKPIVNVVRPKTTAANVDLLLPGDVQAYQATAVYARINGYLKPLPPGIDIGARVKAGQLIAEIAAPEVDAELEQAKASLEQAKVTVGRATNEFNFNQATFDRYQGFSKTGGVTQQQLDEKRAAYNIATSSLKAAQAAVLAAQANVKRLTELQGFQKVTAPFDGTITARNYDAGALISATNTAAGKELFRIEQTDTLRVFVSVPQGSSTDVRPGQDAELLVRNYPGQPFKGAVARTAGALDQATRTMRVEVDVPNPDHKLLPRMYGQIRFTIPRARPALLIPTSAMVFGPEGLRVAVVDDASRAHFRIVTVGRDFGSEAEITHGVTATDHVVTNPGEHLAEGIEVQVNTPKPKHTSATASAAQPEGPRK